MFSLLKRRFHSLPIQVHINLTDRCPLRCRICDIWKKGRVEELTTDQWKKVIEGIVRWIGPVAVNFSGGEPLMRSDMVEIVKFCTGMGMATTMNTNGLLLNKGLARELSEAGLDILYISLDGMEERTHDYIRGGEGSFRKIMDVIRDGRLPGPMRIVIAVVINRLNTGQIPALLDFVRERGYFLVLQPLFQNFGQLRRDDWYRESEFFPSSLFELDRAIDLLIEEKRMDGPVCNSVEHLFLIKGYFRDPSITNGLPCNAGHSDFAIDSTGRFLLCYNLPPVGDLKESPPGRIWFSKEAGGLRDEIRGCRRTCNILNCNYPRIPES